MGKVSEDRVLTLVAWVLAVETEEVGEDGNRLGGGRSGGRRGRRRRFRAPLLDSLDEDDEGDEAERLPHSDLLGKASVDGDVVASSNYITAMARLGLGLGNREKWGREREQGAAGCS